MPSEPDAAIDGVILLAGELARLVPLASATAGACADEPTYPERYRRHAAALADGEVTAGRPYGLMFAGQRNIGGLGGNPGTLPAFGVTTSDGWQYSFHAIEDAEAFAARYAPRAPATGKQGGT